MLAFVNHYGLLTELFTGMVRCIMSFATERLKTVKPSASAGISQQAKAMRKAGQDIIDLGLGEPDFDTPEHIIEAAFHAARSGQTRYPPTGGTAELKDAVSEKFKRDNQLNFSPEEIIISNGAKQVIFNALMATLEPQHEVLVCTPYFDSYKNIVGVLGAKLKVIECSAKHSFCLQPEELESAISENTRWLILNSPSNPAGAVYTATELKALAEVLAKHPNVLVLADEIYEHIVFDDFSFPSFASTCPELATRVLTVNGVSKAYAMTGWRIGYAGGAKELISAMTTVQSQVSSGACSVAQAAAVAALKGPQDCVADFREAFGRRRNLVVEAVDAINGLKLSAPKGAFYSFIDCSAFIGAYTATHDVINNEIDFVSYLLSEAGVAAVPGSAYGVQGFFRVSNASSDDLLAAAFERIALATQKLTRA